MSDELFPPDLAVFQQLGDTDDERAFLARLPELVASAVERWGLRVTGAPYGTGAVSWTAPVSTASGEPAVLKVGMPHDEAREEATALRLWDGEAAVRVLGDDPSLSALLLERCDPGTRLSEAGLPPEEALDVAAELLASLWARSASATSDALEPFDLMVDVTSRWGALVRERMARHHPPLDPALVERGASLLEELPRTADRTVVVHGDFNPGNVLAAARRPWLVIDPKPMVGDPAYDPGQMIGQVDPPWERLDERDAARLVRVRFERFAAVAGRDPDRMLAWTFARTVEYALWAADRNRTLGVELSIPIVRVLADATGL